MTAGPTHEPIDAVRYIANRSSGRMGIALALEGVTRGWHTTLLLGPVSVSTPDNTNLAIHRFRTSDDLQNLLETHSRECDVLIMAAAVADYRPKTPRTTKMARMDEGMSLELEPVEDLIARCARDKRDDQFFVGFALESRDELESRGARKLQSKGLNMIVANPLETMDAEEIEGLIIGSSESQSGVEQVPPDTKESFARVLLDRVAQRLR
ncbi:MAG: phosphopantothenoylcysteine decarboxylase [Phycisphaerales bacterium JB043]